MTSRSTQVQEAAETATAAAAAVHSAYRELLIVRRQQLNTTNRRDTASCGTAGPAVYFPTVLHYSQFTGLTASYSVFVNLEMR